MVKHEIRSFFDHLKVYVLWNLYLTTIYPNTVSFYSIFSNVTFLPLPENTFTREQSEQNFDLPSHEYRKCMCQQKQ